MAQPSRGMVKETLTPHGGNARRRSDSSAGDGLMALRKEVGDGRAEVRRIWPDGLCGAFIASGQ